MINQKLAILWNSASRVTSPFWARTAQFRLIRPRSFPSVIRGFRMSFWRTDSAARNALAQVAAISKSQAVIEFNLDGTIITATRDEAGKVAAISRAQAVIEFNLDGTISTANENFLAVLGYSLDEIKGKHHSMFVAPAERDGGAYREFWAKLNRGEFQSAEY